MKGSVIAAGLLGLGLLISGCRTYDYRVLQPAQFSQRIADDVSVIQYDPLEYRLQRSRDRLMVRITNPTSDRITLVGNRSYVIAPSGESHPLTTQVIGPHSYATLFVPPKPIRGEMVSPNWGWGPGFYPGYGPSFWGSGFYGATYFGPAVTEYQAFTSYDWRWVTGPARLRLSYERDGNTFEHDLELVRERAK